MFVCMERAMRESTPLQPQRLGYGPDELARLLGVCRDNVFKEIAAGRLKARKFGRRTIIEHTAAMEWLSSLPVREASAA